MNILLATTNNNKITEITGKVNSFSAIKILSLKNFNVIPEIIEDGETFLDNAIKKATIICEFAATATMADDSGLEINALNGEPGVMSARYGGKNATDDDKNNLVLKKLSGVPAEKRTARFICAMALVLPDGTTYTTEGTCEGIIALEKKGTYGFGYDPIFYLPEYEKTMAELPLSEKNRISHRAIALEKMTAIIEALIMKKPEL